jgi:hypothetical protein
MNKNSVHNVRENSVRYIVFYHNVLARKHVNILNILFYFMLDQFEISKDFVQLFFSKRM